MPSEKDDAELIDWLRDRASKTRSGTRYTYQPDAEANRYDAIAARLEAQAAELAKAKRTIRQMQDVDTMLTGERAELLEQLNERGISYVDDDCWATLLRENKQLAAELAKVRGENERLRQLANLALALPHATTMRNSAERRGDDDEVKRWDRYVERAFELAEECGLVKGTPINIPAAALQEQKDEL